MSLIFHISNKMALDARLHKSCQYGHGVMVGPLGQLQDSDGHSLTREDLAIDVSFS